MQQAGSELLLNKSAVFESASSRFQTAFDGFHVELAQIPLLSAILIWAKNIAEDKVFGKRYLDIMKELVSSKLLSVIANRSFIALEAYSTASHETVISGVKNYSPWYLQKREDSVSLYITFTHWLSEATVGYIKPAQDADRIITSKRKLPFEKYIELLSRLPERERIIAKLFYLGGARSLNDILALKISEVDFGQYAIRVSNGSIKYPSHVIEDIKSHLGERRKGFVFSNTLSTDRIHHTVPYRALKKAAQEIGLSENFSYKNLVEDV